MNSYFIDYWLDDAEIASLPEDVLLTQIRVWAHWLDAAFQFSLIQEIRYSEKRLHQLSKRLEVFQKKDETNRDDFQWAKRIEAMYQVALEEGNFTYPTSERPRIEIDFSAFEKLLTSRRSIRHFSSGEVDEKTIEKLIGLATWAPTNCNQQSLRYFVIRTDAIRTQFSEASMRGDMSPCIIAVVADMRFYHHDDMENSVHDSGAAIQNLLLTAHVLGLGGCYTSSQNVNSDKHRILLNLPPYQKIMALIWIGYPETYPIPPARGDVKRIITWI